MAGTFGQKPTDSHVVWTNRPGEGEGKKRFDFEYLELWASQFALDYESRTRVDHERSDDPRTQHVVVFAWTEASVETIEMGDSTWDLGGNETPRTFVEIDDAGEARIRSWDHETVVDLQELRAEGPVLRFGAPDLGEKALDTRKLRRSDG